MVSDDSNLFHVVGTDITSLESAWSAVLPSYSDGILEKMAPVAFKECVQKYIYYRKLHAPIPWDEMGITNPLMELWLDSSVTDEAIDERSLVQEGSSAELEKEEEIALLETFCTDIQEEFDSYLSWLQFQLSTVVTDGYLSRLSASGRDPSEPILEAHEIVRRAAQKNVKFLAAIKSFDKIDRSLLANWHYSNCRGNYQFRSDIAMYAMSYAYSLFYRGRKYGKKLTGKSYSPHWSRIPGQCLNGIDKVEPAKHEFLNFASWGDIVYSLVVEKFIRRDIGMIKDLLKSIRNSVQSGNFDLRRKSIKDQVRILEIAGVKGKPTKKLLYQAATSLPQELVEKIPTFGPALAPMLRIITFLGNSRWVEKVDAKFTRMAMWDAYQKAFYIPKVVGREPSKEGHDKEAR